MTKVWLYLPLGKNGKKWSGLGGAERRLLYIFSRLNKEKFDVKIIIKASNPNHELKGFIGEYSLNWDKDVIVIKNHFQLVHMLCIAKPKVIFYTDSMIATKVGVVLFSLFKVKKVLLFVTLYYSKWTFKKKWHSLVMKHNVYLANILDTLYPKDVEYLRMKFKKKEIFNTPISLSNYDYYINKKIDKKNIILYASRLIPEKNPMLVIEAAQLIKEYIRQYKYQIFICGDGPLMNILIKKINENEIGDIVLLKGIQKMDEITPLSKIFLSLQADENYPSQSLLEAISSGCYCIATNVGDTKEIVTSDFGELIQQTKNDLAEAILRAIRMDKKAYMLANQNAKNFGLKKFNPVSAIHHYETIISKMSKEEKQ